MLVFVLVCDVVCVFVNLVVDFGLYEMLLVVDFGLLVCLLGCVLDL